LGVLHFIHYFLANITPIVRENQHKAVKVWDAYNMFLLEAQQIRAHNKQTHQLTVSQLKTMVKWFHCDGDKPMPQKKINSL